MRRWDLVIGGYVGFSALTNSGLQAPHALLLYSCMTEPDGDVLTRKDHFDCCAKQAELAFNSFNARREHQFKITLGLWALLLLTTQFVLVKLHNRPSLLLCVLIAALVVVIHASFVCGIWLKSHFDEEVFYHFRREGIKLLAGDAYDPSGFPRRLKFRECWKEMRGAGSSLFQIATTILLSSACVAAVQRIPLK